jgi:DNA-binding NarL/FixJ family response regulator
MRSSEISATKPRLQEETEHLGVLIFAATSVLRAGLERLLEREPGIEVLGSTSSLTDFTAYIAQQHPDVLLIHAEGSVSGPLLQLRAHHLPAVLLVGDVTADFLMEVLSRGVGGLLRSNSSAREIADALRTVAAGLIVLAPEFIATLSEAARNQRTGKIETASASSSQLLEELTPREHEILEMMMEGLSNKEIAVQLDVSVHTVKFHISSILGKLGATSRTEAATIGLRRGLITI